MLRRFLAGGASLAALLAAAPALAEAVDSPIATAPTEIVEYVRDPQPVAAFKLAQLTLTPSYAAVFGRNAPAITPVNFVPNAVTLSPTFSPQWTGLSNSPTFVLYMEFRCLPGVVSPDIDKNQSCRNTIGFGNFLDSAGDAEHQRGIDFVQRDAPTSGGLARLNTGGSTIGDYALAAFSGVDAIFADGKMHSLLWYADAACVASAGVKCSRAELDGVVVASGLTDQAPWTGALTFGFAANPFYLNVWNGTQAAGNMEVGRFYLDLNSGVSPTLPSSNSPSFSTAAFGTAASPKDFGATGSLPLGHAPTIYMCNPAATYLTNCNGVGPNPTATQQVASAALKIAFDASIRPGETPDRPWKKGIYNYNWGLDCAAATQTCTKGFNGGWGEKTGDLRCWFITVDSNNSGANNAFAMSGYTQLFGGTVVSGQTNLAGFCKTVTADLAAGQTLSPPTFTWTNNSGGFIVGANITYVNFGQYGAGGTTPSIAASAGQGYGTGSMPLPNVTAPAGASLYCGVQVTYGWEYSPAIAAIAPPSTSFRIGLAAAELVGANAPVLFCEKINAAGTVSRTAQGNPGNPLASGDFILN